MSRSPQQPSTRSAESDDSRIYQALKYLSRLAVWVYFRHVHVISRKPISPTGPLLIAANHMNMVLDPAVLIATFPQKRPCHFWALARFFKIPIAGKVLHAAGVLPVDTKTHSNAKLFEHTLQCLEHGGVIALFPEGTSYTLPHHLPFKDGMSWAAFEFLSHHPDIPLTVIPVGITYTTKNKWRSDVVVEYGEPIRVTSHDLQQFKLNPKPAVKDLTAKIAHGVEQGTINSPDWDTLHAAAAARFILFDNTKLEDYVRVSQSLIQVLRPTEDNKDTPNELKNRLLTFSKNLRLLRLSPQDISMYEKQEITLSRAVVRLASTWTALAVQIPLFLPGIMINWPIYLFGRLAERYEQYTESVAQSKLVFSVVIGVPLYMTLSYQVWKYLDYTLMGLVLAMLLIPLLAWYHMALVDKRYDMLKQVVASWRICVAVISGVVGLDALPRQELEDAVHLRRWCRAQLIEELRSKAKMGDSHAQYLVQFIPDQQ
ncbi:hypothetical protein LRAMOSA08481 [Lichtheimia ramosa]|uniref:Phospholipid/glycerol acyltransferase domain-containing protein n=1 Tax=Lichtheimia ramosa TaxID=688394 RepID=A0A077WFS3_9FUNG|nr:hypothetical protein LRAMOSA08481 [Lichtheimia ramosa]